MKRQFPIFDSHLDLAHSYWKKGVQKDSWAIDATCGNGHDTLVLAQLCEGVIALDIQEEALEKARKRCENHLNITFLCQSHEELPTSDKPISLIVYNLGYLPGGDKQLTTQVASTLASLEKALNRVLPGGIVSITCYPGHGEGKREEEALLAFSAVLSPETWSVSHHRWQNRQKSPSLILFQKNAL